VGRRAGAVVPLAIASLLLGACGGPPEPEIVELARPDVSPMEPAVRGQLESGLEALDALVASGAKGVTLADAFGELGMRYHAYDLLDAAEACYLNASRLAPRDPGWHHLLGLVYERQGRLDDSVRHLERALELRPTSAATVVTLGEVHVARQRPDLAEPLLQGAARIEITRPRALHALGRLALAREDHATAVRYLEEARALAPQATVLNYPLGLAHRGVGHAEQARHLLESRGKITVPAGDQLLSIVNSRSIGAQAHVVRGITLFEEGAVDLALAAFRTAIEVDPENAQAWTNLGAVLTALGDAEGAQGAFEEALRLDPADPKAHYNLGTLLARQGDDEAAIPHYEAALAADPDLVGCHFNLANALRRRGRLDEAEPQAASYVEVAPDDPRGHHLLAVLRVLQGRWQEASEAVEAGLGVVPEDRLLRQDMARLLAASPDPAVRDGERALALAQGLNDEERNQVHVEVLAMALAESGRLAEAVQVQEAVLEAAQQAGREDLVRRLTPNLEAYRSGRACREPWPAGARELQAR
jgi:superkiller protein 3